MNKVLLMIFGMTLVTYIPRLLPFILVSTDKLTPFWSRFLMFIPCSALGAMIIPDALFATPQMPLASILGIIFSVVYAWFKGGIIVPVVGSILITFLMLSI